MMPEVPPAATRFCPICEARLDAAVCPIDGVPTVRSDFERGDVADDALGRVIAGRFRVEQLLGEGASGRVYLATQLSVDRPVALKLLQPHHARDRVHVRRFYREARAATRLASAHVVRILDFGVDDETRTPFIAMELLQGQSLRDVLGQRGPLEPRAAAKLGAQIARALSQAAEAGIVHRDLKPANIMWVEDRDLGTIAKVMDFGIAKDLGQGTTDTLTAQGAAIGTPTYMAPEQVSGGEVGPRTDLYALGCILYELIVGRPPFDKDARAELYVDHLLTPAPPMPARVAAGEVPPELVRLVARLLAKTPEERPASAREVADALEAIARDEPKRRRAMWPFLAFGLTGALGLGAALIVASEESPGEAAAAPASAEPLFDQLVVSGGAALIRVHEGAPRPVAVTGDATRVTNAIVDGQLSLTIGAPSAGAAPLEVDVWSPLWKAIKVTGAATVVGVTRLTADELSLGLAGSARADIELVGKNVTTSIRGSSEARLHGAIERHEVRTAGAARLIAKDLVTDETSLAAAGTSDATVYARTHLDARNEGTGEVIYYGRPIEITTDGTGLIQQAEPSTGPDAAP